MRPANAANSRQNQLYSSSPLNALLYFPVKKNKLVLTIDTKQKCIVSIKFSGLRQEDPKYARLSSRKLIS
jgi:hypothetical protein